MHKESGDENILRFLVISAVHALYDTLVALFPLCTGICIVNVDIVLIRYAVMLVVLTQGKNNNVGSIP